ncbi:class I SAM-dependent methyltransferase [Streptomyces aidingensis]|uniref:Methyltransferase domain-containing protein n=1 Tax=Streptomyces aidingensis TaxID=910347 RepID=A0A1I1MVX1_9ACTN|nr:class I SAM-dependent methyltransferase [Streptomyces aidingensis]SFC89551.1 Methyltransferase domain-containing protein [Streptomyces aidingensis]
MPKRRRLTVERHGRHDHGHFDGRRSRSYDRLARWTLRGLYRQVAREVAAVAPPDGRVLDIGTGPGRLLHELAALRPDLRLTGVDVSADMVALGEQAARKRGLSGRITLRTGDVAALPEPDRGTDVVVTTLSMHHWPDLPAAAAELERVLRPGGRVMVYDFRFAPLEEAEAALRARPRLAASPVRRGPLRPGWNPFPWYARLVLAAGGETGEG